MAAAPAPPSTPIALGCRQCGAAPGQLSVLRAEDGRCYVVRLCAPCLAGAALVLGRPSVAVQ